MTCKPVGPMDIDRERQLRTLGWIVTVRLDGVDVTDRTHFADDTPGCACIDIVCQCADNGRMYVAHLEPANVTIDVRRT